MGSVPSGRWRRTFPVPAVLAGLTLLTLALCGCAVEGTEGGGDLGAERATAADRPGGEAGHGVEGALSATLRQATTLADSVEDLLRPVPLMRPAEEEALRQYPNARHVERGRSLGLRPESTEAMEAAIADGRLVRLEDSTEHWVLREMGASRPVVTPGARSLLVRLGEAFHAELAERGLPPYRFEISSALRTPEGQAALRRSNPNAASGTSAHEFGTTVDIPYSAYAAPAELPAEIRSALEGVESPEIRAELETVARLILDRMAARKSRELKAILGDVMREAQSRGEVYVTLERQQPVYHITVAR